MALSVRENIMLALKARLEAMHTGYPVDDPYAFKFDIVQREEFGSSAKGKKYGVAVFDTDSVRVANYDPVRRADLSVILEFLIYISTDENPNAKMNQVFSEVERAIMEDSTFGGLCLDTTITRDEKSIDGRFDKYAEGALYLTINYRYNNSDPRSVV